MARHISEYLVGLLCGEAVKRFNLYAVQGLETDLRVIEGWAEKRSGAGTLCFSLLPAPSLLPPSYVIQRV